MITILRGSFFLEALNKVEKSLALHYNCSTKINNVDTERCKPNEFALKQWSLSYITTTLPGP